MVSGPHLQSEPSISGMELRVRGLVQGVGFRPTVWRLAHRFGLVGEVLNDGAGVLIRAWGTAGQLSDFETALNANPPPLARIDALERTVLSTLPGTAGFRIVNSETGIISTAIVADAATCPECLAETLSPTNRRYRYPFTNCTHCGPRLSIVRAIPYDRATTSMAAFPMCAACLTEYEDPADRRFHAEPNACPTCGPRVWLEDEAGVEMELPADHDPISLTAELIKRGAIIAIKGIGGFHLACNAIDTEAVARLRRRKRRYHKPFALMALDAQMIAEYAHIGEAEKALLSSSAAPIVVLDRRDDAPDLAPELAPEQTTLGFMLPYTPLHHVLMRHLDGPIVLTSGNTSDEPQCVDNADARHRLKGVADMWLLHNRDIVNRLDDSVARVSIGGPTLLRRARGYAPEPIRIPADFDGMPPVLALGAELKSTFCLLAESRAIVSQHIGDLEDAATHDDYRAALRLYRELFAFDPEVIAIDAHPDYLSSQWGRALTRETGASLTLVQHHHAHIAAALAEHEIPVSAPAVLGIVLDGLGLGEGGEFWGGEFLRADYHGFKRLASFCPAPLVGGNRAMREPWRNAFAHLNAAFGWTEIARRHPDLAIIRRIGDRQPDVLTHMVENGLNAPPASSAGRLFDAAAAMIGIRPDSISYEGQAAIELEALARPAMEHVTLGYPFDVLENEPIQLGWAPFWTALLRDLDQGVDQATMAARIHRGVFDGIGALAERLCHTYDLKTAVLSGGVFQNRILLEHVTKHLRKKDIEVLSPRCVPANDGGISLGQAVVASVRANAGGRAKDRSRSHATEDNPGTGATLNAACRPDHSA